MANTGNDRAARIFGEGLGYVFKTWDDMVARAHIALPGMIEDNPLPSPASVLMVGISESRGPEIVAFETEYFLPPGATMDEREASGFYTDPGKLVRLPNLIMTPSASDQSIAASYDPADFDGDIETTVWAMRRLLHMQRCSNVHENLDACCVGGWAILVTVFADRIETRCIERWNDGAVEKIALQDPQWDRWHRENPKPKRSIWRRRAA